MARLTKLEAVNIMLDAIGETPVSSLNSGLPDAEAAQRVLLEVSRDVQESGYHCNTDEEVTLVPQVDGTIALPQNTLRVDSTGDSQIIDVVERNGKLYDRDNHTDVFTASVIVDLVIELDYEQLPYRLANYIARRAARVYHERVLGSVALDSMIQKNEDDSKAKLEDSEFDSDDANVLRQSESAKRIAYRNNPLFGR
jgi:hypothetical protein